ncbi:aminopeptidase P family N-terminal domain-containing protein [Bradyrhizobium centrosematis]|uniref:aminopeptidase P family N-terminal domain-containing protein n=1 Tax=Bradyrhizobium centrosematis TaxID=1300039 RepID=UPI00388EFFFB
MTLTKGPQAFPRSEYLRRVAAVKSEMARLNVEALFVSNPGNLTYLTGFLGRSSAPQCSFNAQRRADVYRTSHGCGCSHLSELLGSR